MGVSKRGSSAPEQWSNAYSYGPNGPVDPKKGNCFRSIKMPALGYFHALDEDSSKVYLRSSDGFLPPLSGRKCWKCSSNMNLKSWESGQVLRCENLRCKFHCNADRSYTPMHNGTIAYKEFYALRDSPPAHQREACCMNRSVARSLSRSFGRSVDRSIGRSVLA